MLTQYPNPGHQQLQEIPPWPTEQLAPYRHRRPIILDCAPGTGHLIKVLDSLNLRPNILYGIDRSPELALAAKSSGRYLDVITADLAQQLPFTGKNYFHISIVHGPLELIADPLPLLTSLYQACAKGGILLCSFEQARDGEDAIFFLDVGAQKPMQRFARSKTTVARILKKAGWLIEEIATDLGPRWYCQARKLS